MRALSFFACALLLLGSSSCVRARAESVPVASSAAPLAAASSSVPPVAHRELPRGGREIFPRFRLVGFCGTPGAPALGRLWGDLSAKAKKIEEYADKHAQGRESLPVFELIAVVVQGVPGPDGKWRHRVDDDVVATYLRAAREARALLVLNIQPGQSDFVTEAKHFEKYFREPDVGIALDPEWAMRPRQKPGDGYGQTSGATINEISAYLSAIVKENDLPEKPLVFHQVAAHVVKGEAAVTPAPGVAIIMSADGLGSKHAKMETYDVLAKVIPPGVHAGFKLFFSEDVERGGKLMSPSEVMALVPQPEYVMYE